MALTEQYVIEQFRFVNTPQTGGISGPSFGAWVHVDKLEASSGHAALQKVLDRDGATGGRYRVMHALGWGGFSGTEYTVTARREWVLKAVEDPKDPEPAPVVALSEAA